MVRLKLIPKYPNYACIGSTHIFINFGKNELELLSTINPKSIDKIHIFVSSHSTINNMLKILIEKYSSIYIDGYGLKKIKIIIHLPKKLSGIKELFNKFESFKNGYKLLTEKYGTDFSIQGVTYHYILKLDYLEDGIKMVLHVKYPKNGPVTIDFPVCWYDEIDRENDEVGIFKTGEMKLHPDLFKDKLIKGFKKSCPEKILSTFKDDVDIWNYIMQKSDWEIRKDEGNVDNDL